MAADRIAPQAGPSVQDSLAQETETGSQECNPRPQVRSPDIGRSLKRKASETVDESGGEERNSKVCTSRGTLIHRHSCVMCVTAGQAVIQCLLLSDL